MEDLIAAVAAELSVPVPRARLLPCIALAPLLFACDLLKPYSQRSTTRQPERAQQTLAKCAPDPALDDEPALRPPATLVYGQTFLRTGSGEVKLGAGVRVGLVPMSVRVLGLLADGGNGTCWLHEAVLEAAIGARSTTTDAAGRFRFDGVQQGSYLLFTRITWVYDLGYGRLGDGGGRLLHILSVDSTKPIEVVMANEDAATAQAHGFR